MNARRFLLSIGSAVLFVTGISGQDLSSYRKFAFGADLAVIAKQAGLRPAEAQTISQRPQLIQSLDWQPRSMTNPSPAEWKSVKGVLFRFYNGALFSLAVTYDRDSTAGMTVEDMIDAISVNYGTPTKPAEEVFFPSIYAETLKVLARWEDSEYSFRLVQSSYPTTFGLLGTSKKLDALASAALTQAKAIDTKEAPQKEIDRVLRDEATSRLELEKLRQANKIGFRP